MPRTVERIPLVSPSPGTERFLIVHRYGEPGTRPKAYMQASLHADEWPGQMALHHLIPMLDEADAEDRIRGEIVLVAYANPIGMSQRYGSDTLGRYAMDGSGNFNRGWPDLTAAVAARLNGPLDRDTDRAVEQIRGALKAAVADLPRRTETMSHRAVLLSLSIDADCVLDLHCDGEALKHVYANVRHEAEAGALARDMDIPVVLLEEEAGGGAFDEANARVWWKLADLIDDADGLPCPCFGCTVELRGRQDVSDRFGTEDAAGLFRYLIRQGNIEGDAGPTDPPEAPYRLDEVDVVSVPTAGLVSYRAELGDRVSKGETVADLIDPTADNPPDGRREIKAGTSGLFFARMDVRLAVPGDRIAKIAGREPLAHRKQGALLED